MNRRDFLLYSAAAAAASSVPSLALGEIYVPGMEVLTPAFDRARARGKALLCLLVTDDEADRWKRGGAFGDMLLISDDTTMADLAQVDVVCAGEREVRSYTDWLDWNEGCLMALIETAVGEPSQPCSSASLPSPLIPHDYEGAAPPSASRPSARASLSPSSALSRRGAQSHPSGSTRSHQSSPGTP
jgi:hypothetical protein